LVEYHLDVTLDVARSRFRKESPQEMAENAGAFFDAGTGLLRVWHLGQEYLVSYPDGEVRCEAGPRDVPIVTQIVILHYLETAQGAPLRNQLISFKELPGGQIYIEPFRKRAILPLTRVFGDCPGTLIRAAAALRGTPGDLGDVSVTIPVFERVPITYVVWAGDDEFSPSGNVLFDASAPAYLPTEDYAVLAGLVVWELKKTAGRLPTG